MRVKVKWSAVTTVTGETVVEVDEKDFAEWLEKPITEADSDEVRVYLMDSDELVEAIQKIEGAQDEQIESYEVIQ